VTHPNNLGIPTDHGHQHTDENGMLVKCYHKCRTELSSAGFWVGVTISFPVEHFLWEKVWPLKMITHWLGL
jgi:hypothetical protein